MCGVCECTTFFGVAYINSEKSHPRYHQGLGIFVKIGQLPIFSEIFRYKNHIRHTFVEKE
ncbi:Uncharacterised protein [Porphyromonas cangingivalis]|uniref:Uncharacterized protein n=1 Tax=Porphyromonas cangingivalis TaxID=36874 RepID=A0A1T4JWI9_PORCN|nr:hypothetical protein SAMN02745205_00401 [Porphyromonas cangingivalis]VEJ03160.1 Uncharacterised protein [Porphyromonas cangingivalis]